MGSKTTSQVTNAANPAAQAAYTDVIGKAQQVAGTPYQPYPGELVAGLNQGQNAAVGQLAGAYGAAQPYIGEGNRLLGFGAQGLGNVQNYLTAASGAAAGASQYQGAASDQLGQANGYSAEAANTNSGIGQYQGQAGGSFGQAGSYGAQAAGALAGMQPYMGQVQQGLGTAGGTYGTAAATAGGAQSYYGAEAAGLGQVGGYLGAASGMLGQAQGLAAPQQFSGAALQQYENPYTQGVINSTMANLNENDAQQSQQLSSGAIGAGAYGGDRAGVAQAELARQQDLANNQTVSGLESQNYSQALGQWNAAQGQRQAAAGLLNQGAGQMAGLGSAQLQTALGYGNVGAGLGSNAGTLAGIASGQTGNAGAYNTLAQDQAAAASGLQGLGSLANATGSGFLSQGQLQGQQAQQYGTLGTLANQTAAGYNSTGQLGLGQAGAYGTLGQLQGTTGQAYGTMSGLAGNLGSLNESTQISGASAGLQGATLGQQNAQQQDTAAYNQYMAGLSYPYQNVGFLSNIVQGIGSQQGNTQTTQGNALSSIAGLGTSAIGVLGATGGFGANGYLSGLGSSVGSMFSDARVKEDIAPVGKTFDGQTLYRFRYKGDPTVQTGLMAQDVEQHTPEAVGSVGGIKTVDYGKATANAAALGLGARESDPRPQRATGGPVGLGARPHFDAGGNVDPNAVTPIPSGGISFAPSGLTAGGGLDTTPFGTSAASRPQGQPQQGLGVMRSNLATMGPTSPQFAGQPASQQSGLGSAPISFSGSGGSTSSGTDTSSGSPPSGGGMSQNAWMGIMAAGLGMMSGTSMSGAANIGQGGLEGMKMYQGLQQQDRQNAFQQGELALRGRQADQSAAYQQGSLGLEKQKENFSETQAQRMYDASIAAAASLRGETAPLATAAQGAAPTGSSSPSVASPTAPAPGQGTGPTPVPSAAPASTPPPAGFNSTIPGSIAPVPALAQQPPAAPAPAPSGSSGGPSPGPASNFDWSKVAPDSNPGVLAQQAQRFSAAGQQFLAGGQGAQANQMFERAQMAQNRARQIYDTGKVAMVDGSVGVLPGFNAAQASTVTATETAKAGVQDQHDLVKVADPNGGGEQYVPKSVVMSAAQGGQLPQSGPPGAGSAPGTSAATVASAAPYLASNPAFIAKAQESKAEAEAQMDQQFQQRQVSLQRINDLQSIMTKYQTGDLAGAKADAVAFGRAVGIPVKDTDTANAVAFQRYGKDAMANVFSDVKSQGGKVLVSEIEGLQKANANAEMQPGANAAILNQAKGIIGYEDQHYKDYMGWRDQNPNAWNSSKFEIGWQGKNNVQQYVDKAGKDFAYKGQEIPDAGQRTAGQMYMTPKGPLRWMGSGWAAN